MRRKREGVTFRFIDEEEGLGGNMGKRAAGESIFGGFLNEIVYVFGAYVCSPCFLPLP